MVQISVYLGVLVRYLAVFLSLSVLSFYHHHFSHHWLHPTHSR